MGGFPLFDTGGGGFSGSSSADVRNSLESTFRSAFDNSGFVVNQGSDWKPLALIAGAALLGLLIWKRA